MDIHERVEAGVKYMTYRLPGWLSLINVDTLDMGDTSLSIMGQVFGSDERGIMAFELNKYALVGLGLKAIEDEHTQLTEVWRQAIEQRRNEIGINLFKINK